MNYKNLPTLETERILLRPAAMSDALDVFSYASDPKVCELLEWGPSSSIQETREIISLWLSGYKGNTIAPWVIVYKTNNSVIGTVEARVKADKPEVAELGYCLSRSYWGRGFMPEVLDQVMDYVVGQELIKRIIALVRGDNVQSQRALEKVGFVLAQKCAEKRDMKGVSVCLDLWERHKK